jgi:hypothetical protein
VWEQPTAIHTALAQIGVPLAQLSSDLTPKGLAPFAAYL